MDATVDVGSWQAQLQRARQGQNSALQQAS